MTALTYDVIIYNIVTREIDAVIGKEMNLDKGFYNAERRLNTVLTGPGRLDTDRFWAIIVDAGKYKKGDVLPKKERGR